jgi:hypothetical protein
MDAMIEYHTANQELPSLAFAHKAYTSTKKGSAMSKYAVHGIHLAIRNCGTIAGWPTDELTKLVQMESFAKDFFYIFFGTIKSNIRERWIVVLSTLLGLSDFLRAKREVSKDGKQLSANRPAKSEV